MADSQFAALFRDRQDGLALLDDAGGQQGVIELVRKMLLGDRFGVLVTGKSDFSAI
jgi:hypothetical protein